MSTETEDLRVKFNRNLHHDGREQSEVEILEDEEQISHHGLQQTEKQKLKNLQAKRRNCFRVLKLFLGVFYFLILAGLMTRYILSLENNKMNNDYNQLRTELSVINKTLLDEIKELKNKIEGKQCPETWMRFGKSCYFKSTKGRTWADSRSFCQFKGADLLFINSKEEQEFVSKLTPNQESWIGLYVGWSLQKYEWEWEWVDGSSLTETFWDETFSESPYYNNAVFLSTEGKWKRQYYSTYRTWICEK
ncbi:CD209 antigen-like protein E isoform X1 [Oryzias melastigma]|uniref:CD209 antigen-like protein E isoform X1 n=1 Tax=Oryzias melastigma TaxID=30732 RepID=UPI000CF806AA|nr:CD209 antigen-like protein E isoform X1 [Oryzias melastigma]